jgi:hypothetical protein
VQFFFPFPVLQRIGWLEFVKKNEKGKQIILEMYEENLRKWTVEKSLVCFFNASVI